MKLLSSRVKEEAYRLGFDLCGIARSRPLKERAMVLSEWCSAGMNHIMSYLERDIEKRADPEKYFPGTRTVIATGINYYNPLSQTDVSAPVLSRYTYGRDYHKVISEKLNALLDFIKETDRDIKGKITVDTSPVMEKAWAVESGIGWQGKNSVVINKLIGSFFFIGLILLDKEFDYDEAEDKDHCQGCRKCIDECPVGAINDNRTVDARLCLANLTMGKRGPLPGEILPYSGRRIYGCDKCQEVCPWNNRIPVSRVPEFRLNGEIAEMTAEEWKKIGPGDFARIFSGMPVSGLKYEQFKRNIELFYD